MTLSTGTRLGPYEILASIGAGGMGEVYRARDTRLDREVAVKVLPQHVAAGGDALSRFEREAKAIAALSHANILAIHDFGRSGDVAYAVMELLDGQTLRALLAEGPLPGRKAIEYAIQIARGLNAAHEKGIVHRDLKPDNVIVTRDGRVKVLDFGLARQSQEEKGDLLSQSPTVMPGTEPGTVLGTVGYMSPEQVRGRPADHRSDIFSFGAILHEMLTGRRAFKHDSAVETMNAILREEPPDPSASGRSVPPALDRIVRHCLEKNPEERFQSFRDLAFDLESLSGATTAPAAAIEGKASSRLPVKAAAAALVVVAALAAGYFAGRGLGPGVEQQPAPTFKRITFRRGNLLTARFAPDGQTVVYGAAWEYNPTDIFMARAEASESRSLGFPNSDVLAVSSTGEMAILIKKGFRLGPSGTGTLARVPMSGGAPRELLEDVSTADWMPDASELAVVRRVEGNNRIELPIGQVLFTTPHDLRSMRVSPSGDQVAVIESEPGPKHSIVLIDRKGLRKVLKIYSGIRGNLAWAPDGGEVVFTAEDAVQAVTVAGASRILLKSAEAPILHDVSRDGRLLLESFNLRGVLVWLAPGQQQERDMSWLDQSVGVSLSADAKTLLFADRGGVYIRKSDGSPAIRLSDGRSGGLSPDAKYAVAVTGNPPSKLVVLPTGPGEVREIPTVGVTPLGGFFLPSGKGIVWFGSDKGGALRGYVQDLAGGEPRAFTPEGISSAGPISPDGRFMTGRVGENRYLIPLDGGTPTSLEGLDRDESVIEWTGDGRSLYIARLDQLPVQVQLFEIATRKRSVWRELKPDILAGVIGINSIRIAPDGRSYVYSCGQVVHSDLYIVEGLK